MEHTVLTPKFPHLLHGGDYNPDQWLEYPDILEKDIELMKQAHINCVSLGIFAWAKLEPHEGFYDFEWMAQIIDNLYKNGIYTVLATPSGAKPRWMSEQYPEIRRVGSTGQRAESGGRHNHCLTSPVYRRKVYQMNTALAKRFSHHPGVILWHVSNEYNGDCRCELCQKAFRGWLRKKYGTIENVNRAWWASFWSQNYNAWEEIHPPVAGTALHGLELDWKRFVTDQTVDFMRQEIAAVKAVNPDIPCTANLMGFFEGLNYFKFADALDVVSFDNYPQWHKGDNMDVAAGSAFHYNLMRSIRHEPFLLMENTPSMTNWQEVSKLKRPGMHMLASMQAIAQGTQSVQYFQFRKGRGGFEKFHGAVVDHYGEADTRVFRDVAEVGKRLEAIDSAIYPTAVKPQAAIVLDWENRWAINAARGPRNIGEHYVETLREWHDTLWKMGIPVDFVDMEGDLSGYKLVIAPMLYMYRANFAQKMRAFVENGGTLVGGYQNGIVNDTDLCYLGGVPGDGMMEVFGVWNEEVDALYDGETNSLQVSGLALPQKEYAVSELCALIHARGATVLGTYGSDFYAGMPALTVNTFGKGRAYYVAAKAEPAFLQDFLTLLTGELAIAPALPDALPDTVVAALREGDTPEQNVILLQNYGDAPAEISLSRPYAVVETGETVQQLTMPAYSAVVLKKI